MCHWSTDFFSKPLSRVHSTYGIWTCGTSPCCSWIYFLPYSISTTIACLQNGGNRAPSRSNTVLELCTIIPAKLRFRWVQWRRPSGNDSDAGAAWCKSRCDPLYIFTFELIGGCRYVILAPLLMVHIYPAQPLFWVECLGSGELSPSEEELCFFLGFYLGI